MLFRLTPDYDPTPCELVKRAVELLREHEPPDGYYGCFSGGKDSVAIKALAEMAGVGVEWHYHKTTIDPPELVRFIRQYHPDVIWDRPKYGNFFRRMERNGFPTRRARWCCNEYKERPLPPGAVVIMGIRAEESSKRAARWYKLGTHWRSGNTVLNPIFDWASDELWTFIRGGGIPYCKLYDEGFSRLGCVGCPNAGEAGKLAQFARWPQFEAKWKRSFQRIWERRTGTLQRDGRPWFGDVYFADWTEMWEWWLHDKPLPNKGQLELQLLGGRHGDLYRHAPEDSR